MKSESDYEIFVPGRLAILGEHTDWASSYRSENNAISIGLCLVCVTNEGLYARAHALPNTNTLNFRHVNVRGETMVFSCSMLSEELRANAVGGGNDNFFAYVAGTMFAILEAHPAILKDNIGIDINNYKTLLPMRKGLSSSAAVCVLVVKSCSTVYNLKLTQQQVMDIACIGERMTQSECGMMDFCVAMGAGQVGLMTLAENAYCSLQRVVVKDPLYFVVADLKAGKDTVCILHDLNQCFPVPQSRAEASFHTYCQQNAWLVMDAVKAIEIGDESGNGGGIYALGAAMNASQSNFDSGAINVCPAQLTAPRLHSVLESSELKAISIAAKGVGSQGDGTIQVLCASPHHQQLVLTLLEQELGCEGFLLTVPGSGDSSGDSSSWDSTPLHQKFILTAMLMCDVGADTDRCVDILLSSGVRRVAIVTASSETCTAAAADAGDDGYKNKDMVIGDAESAFSYSDFLLGKRLECTQHFIEDNKNAAVEYLKQIPTQALPKVQDKDKDKVIASASTLSPTRVLVITGEMQCVSRRKILHALGQPFDNVPVDTELDSTSTSSACTYTVRTLEQVSAQSDARAH